MKERADELVRFAFAAPYQRGDVASDGGVVVKDRQALRFAISDASNLRILT
jgi:hypothetical protein